LRSLLAEIETILGRYKSPQIVALRARLGMDGPRTTLENAGRAASLTRERVRQLETRFFTHFLAAPVAGELITRINRSTATSSEPLFLHQLPSKDRWFTGLAPNADLIRVLLPVASAGLLDCVDVPGGAAICNGGVPSWEDLVRNARAAIGSLGKGSSRRSVQNAVRKTLRDCGASGLFSLLLCEVESGIQYSAAGTIVAFGAAGPMIVETILHDADRPLHYSEVARRWSERSGEATPDSRANGALQDSPRVYLLSRGVYGLAKHLPLRGGAAERLAADCVEIMTRVAPKKQWHAAELLDALVAIGRRPSPKVDKYVVDACLLQSGKAQWLGRLVWALPGPGQIAARIDLRDAVVEVLRRAGRPLHDHDLRREVARSRGLNPASFIIAATQQVARTARSTWGLVDRDFFLSLRQRQAVSDAMHAAIESRGHALHVSEIGEVAQPLRIPEAVTPYMLMRIAAVDGRMKLFHGDLLGLSKWGEARRPNLSRAIETVARAVRSPVTIAWVQAEVERLAGRPVRRSSLYSPLRESELRYDTERRVWIAERFDGSDSHT
jgi:hypothetical protein